MTTNDALPTTDTVRPYEDSREHLRDELRRLDLRLKLHVERVRALGHDPPDELSGLYVSDERVDRLLSPDRNGSVPVSSTLQRRLEDLARTIHQRRQATRQAGRTLRLVALSDRFGLGPRHVDALVLALAPELDAKYEDVYGYLHDDLTRTRPTVGLLGDVLTGEESDRYATRELFGDSAPLVASDLIGVTPAEDPLPTRVVRVAERVVAFVLGEDDLDPSLSSVATVVPAMGDVQGLPVDAETRDELERLAPGPDADPVCYYLSGPRGVGKNAAVRGLATEATDTIVRAELDGVAPDETPALLSRLVREARLRDAAVHVAGIGAEGPSIATLARELDAFEGHVFVTGSESWTPRLRLDRHAVAAVHLPRPEYSLRVDLWEVRRDRLPDEIDTEALAATFRLTAGQIDEAIATAEAVSRGGPLTADAVYRGCRAQSTERLESLARKVEPHYTWDDIVLPESAMANLREVAAHVTHRGTVYDDWGFDDRFSLGNGLTVLFTGPSGTGKTMAAEIIAEDAGLALYKIDLANVVNKYIGETEKNLGRIFDEAADSDAVLFFDEADALFGERTDVQDAHDRYANIEVNYLLQRVEEHDGTVILTTNLEGNIDDAFRRRIHLSVAFPLPDRAAREAIWDSIFPAETPVGDLDVEFLSSLSLAGGHIKNVALTGAFLAAEDGGVVEMPHLVRATKREFEKTGNVIDPAEFGQYRHLIDH